MEARSLSVDEITAHLGIKGIRSISGYLKGKFRRTIPDKPCSNKQKYRLTEKGRQVIGERMGGA